MAKSRKIRAVLDTNLWISFLISKRLRVVGSLFDRGDLVLVFSQELLDEFMDVTQRPKFKKYFSAESVEALLHLFDVFGELVEVKSAVEICRDPKDNFLLALAKDGKADYLITGDADLLVIRKFENTEVLTYTEFAVKVSA